PHVEPRLAPRSARDGARAPESQLPEAEIDAAEATKRWASKALDKVLHERTTADQYSVEAQAKVDERLFNGKQPKKELEEATRRHAQMVPSGDLVQKSVDARRRALWSTSTLCWPILSRWSWRSVVRLNFLVPSFLILPGSSSRSGWSLTNSTAQGFFKRHSKRFKVKPELPRTNAHHQAHVGQEELHRH
ncbi:unnamed protein product, partial [Prorocentrum cordatum]